MGWPQRSLSRARRYLPPLRKSPKIELEAIALDVPGCPRPGRRRHLPPPVRSEKSVAVTAIVEHPALDSVRDGVQAALKEAGFESGKNLKWQYQSAQGNTGTARRSPEVRGRQSRR